MNINDFKLEDLKLGPGDKLDQIFARQAELMGKYHSIEEGNGLLVSPDVPVNLHDAKGQFRLKDFAWRITEELGEALEAFEKHPHIRDHYDEELVDALHFLVEYTILAGLTLERFDAGGEDKLDRLFDMYGTYRMRAYDSLCGQVGRVVKALAVACNCLKNKPWKNTHMVTDVDYFTQKVVEVWFRFIELASRSGIDSQKLFDLYFRKSEVNKFRQRSNY